MKKLLCFILATGLLLLLGSCKLGRFAYYNFANITDHEIFPYRTAEKGDYIFTYAVAESGKAPKQITVEGNETTFDAYLEKNRTVAFLIIQNDTIQYEKYFDDYSEDAVVASFSMAKSVTSILIGCAIDDGYIKSVDEPVTNYISELKENGLQSVTIEHLLQMTSGIKFSESYTNPFGDAATFYYGRNLTKAVLKRKLKKEPGSAFSYSSGDTQVLGMVLQRALKGKSITQYLEEKLWKPLGMEYDATWSLDRENGMEKTFCCINARARDFSKIGRLYLNNGNWQGKQIVPEEWVRRSVTADTVTGASFYKYQWWLPSQSGDFMAQGILGQYIYVNPSKNLIIVRLGENYGNTDWRNLFKSLAQQY
ncbi:beta-lactamase family protein [Flavobacterium sp. D11R37]|uniref:serine hydrolase domain-containing protein n=1 Tax=Flavobacterium coralii TaxID=2838017 RepID=UPI001CA6237F|nr:serine hydrolase [Flavobacterium coralii]MBY8961578.1 beta-lactamase family protein [Flavobacterium coralii]